MPSRRQTRLPYLVATVMFAFTLVAAAFTPSLAGATPGGWQPSEVGRRRLVAVGAVRSPDPARSDRLES